MIWFWKLSETEKKYGFRQWAKVLWIALRHPIVFTGYVQDRRWVDQEKAKTPEQKKAELENIIQQLEQKQ